jgi:hypothetical protein
MGIIGHRHDFGKDWAEVVNGWCLGLPLPTRRCKPKVGEWLPIFVMSRSHAADRCRVSQGLSAASLRWLAYTFHAGCAPSMRVSPESTIFSDP